MIENLKYHLNEKIQEKFDMRKPQIISDAVRNPTKFDRPSMSLEVSRKNTNNSNKNANKKKIKNKTNQTKVRKINRTTRSLNGIKITKEKS